MAISQRERPRRPSHVGALGSSVPGVDSDANPSQARKKPPDAVVKVTSSLEAIASAVATSCETTQVRSSDACNAHPKHLAPSLGTKCGRREREAGTGSGRLNLHVPVHATVEGTLVLRMPSAFAG